MKRAAEHGICYVVPLSRHALPASSFYHLLEVPACSADASQGPKALKFIRFRWTSAKLSQNMHNIDIFSQFYTFRGSLEAFSHHLEGLESCTKA